MCVGIFIFSLLFKVATELRIEEFRGQEGKLVFDSKIHVIKINLS